MPAQVVKGLVPTMNQKGFMALKLDAYSQAWVDFSPEAPGPVADIGAAYGVATLACLERGARVTAVDMEPKHLEVLKGRADGEQLSRLTSIVGAIPSSLDFPEESFGAILISRVLHFLEPKEVEESIQKAARWLKRGGKLFIVAETPYLNHLTAFLPTYEARLRAGAKWPGQIADFRRFLSKEEQAHAPERMNFLNPDVLHRVCYEAELDVEQMGFIDRKDYGESFRLDGREGCGVIAVKP